MPKRNALLTPIVLPTLHSQLGWRDYLDGKGFPATYDSWDQKDQRHYERGRLRAAGAYLIYRRIPEREPLDIVQRTNGLKLVPRGWRRRRA
jgi:hypothetical protein